MIKRKKRTKNYEVLLVEYQQIRNEIDGYFKLRNTTLALTISAIGVIIGFSEKIEPLYIVVALNLIINIGAILTSSYTLIAVEKSAYIKVFIEDQVKDLNWFTVKDIDKLYSTYNKLTKWLKLPFDSLPHEYPLIYFFLGVIVSSISYSYFIKTCSTIIIIISAIGAIFLLYSVFLMQYVISNKKYKSLIKYFQNIYKSIK